MSAPNTSADAQIVVEDLVKRFGKFVAVDHVGFRVARGEIMGFLGPNGAGKSTIIRILCGLLRASAGRALVAGIDVSLDPEAVRQRIGYMSQKFSLYRDLTVKENLRFFGGIYRVPASELATRIQFAIDMAGLAGRERALVATLAGGWQQRLALGCAILHRPTLAALQQAPGVQDCSVFGSTLHLLVTNAERAIAELPSYLEAKGLGLSRITRINASLEDVFVQLITADTISGRQAA